MVCRVCLLVLNGCMRTHIHMQGLLLYRLVQACGSIVYRVHHARANKVLLLSLLLQRSWVNVREYGDICVPTGRVTYVASSWGTLNFARCVVGACVYVCLLWAVGAHSVV
jgi:hypothetical protein